MLYEELTYKIRGAFYEIYNTLGPGFKEEIYHNALAKELKLRKVIFTEKKRWAVYYKDEKVGIYEPDFIIEDKVLVEIKSVLQMPKIFEAQLYYYLKGSEYKLGFLVNFGSDKLDIRRRVYESARNPRQSEIKISGHPRQE